MCNVHCSPHPPIPSNSRVLERSRYGLLGDRILELILGTTLGWFMMKSTTS